MFRFPFRPLARSRTLALGLVSAGFALSASAADLTVEVSGARSAQGQVSAALYNGSDAWLKQPQKVKGENAPAAQPLTALVFRGLAPGRYALSIYHDENGNDKLDANVVGVPTEPYGFSRDARGRMGPPAFDDAAFEVQGDTTVHVTLR